MRFAVASLDREVMVTEVVHERKPRKLERFMQTSLWPTYFHGLL
jgi:hypothetical protein